MAAFKTVASLLNRVNLTFPIVLDGRWMRVPTIGEIGYSNLVGHEPWMVDLLQRLMPLRNGAFIDIGVNLGQTLMKVKSVYPDVRYVGFEPNPVCVHYVRVLVRKNAFKDCDIVPVGISNESGLASLGCYGSETDSAATIVEGFRGREIRHRFWVPVDTLENACDRLNLGSVSMIKIDVEGGEPEALQGMGRFLTHVRPLILCEILPVYSAENTFRIARQEAIETRLKAAGYSIWRIQKDKKGHLSGLLPMQTLGVHSDLSLCDYVFIPDEVSDSVSMKVNGSRDTGVL